MWLFNECKHDWVVIQEVTTMSRAELQGECTGKVSSPKDSYGHK